MPSFLSALKSQVGRKILTAITGIGLVVFVIFHLIGNLKIFGAADAFNSYTYFLESLGWILYILEIGLAICFLLHAWIGISIWLKRRRSRPKGYKKYESKQPNLNHAQKHNDWAARTMIISG